VALTDGRNCCLLCNVAYCEPSVPREKEACGWLHHSRATIVLPPIAKHEGEREARAPEFSDKVDLDVPPTEMEVNHPYLISIIYRGKKERGDNESFIASLE
jgi:hypothetical protein